MSQGDQLDTEDWRAFRAASAEKRRDNMRASTAILAKHAVPFEAQDAQGIHLVVRYGGRVVDYWPSTGKWIDRANRGIHMRGVFRLLAHLNVPRQSRS